MLQIGSPDIDPLYVGELNVSQWATALDRMLAFRRDPARDAKFLDIGFAAFQSDPIAEIRRLYAWLGDELADGTVERMRAWRSDNPRDEHGAHTYDPAQFALTEDLFAARFGPYRDRFGALL